MLHLKKGTNDAELAFYLKKIVIETLPFKLLFQKCAPTNILMKNCGCRDNVLVPS